MSSVDSTPPGLVDQVGRVLLHSPEGIGRLNQGEFWPPLGVDGYYSGVWG